MDRKKMKLLILTPTIGRGGAEEYLLTIAKAGIGKGWEVHAAFQRTEETLTLIQDFLASGVQYHPIKIGDSLESQRRRRDQFSQFQRSLLLISRLKPDVVQIVLPYPNRGVGCILACGLARIPTAVVFQLVRPRVKFSQKKLQAYEWARDRNQKWIAVSDHNRRILCEMFHVQSSELVKIYNGANFDGNYFDNMTNESKIKLRKQMRFKLGIHPKTIMILTVGHLVSRKGYQDIIPAIPHIVRNFPNVRFVWVGEGPYQGELNKKIQEYGMEDYVLMLGRRSDVPKLLITSDLFLFPTHSEGLPFSLTEAMAHGLPVISSDSSSIPEVIESRVHGLLFRTEDCCDILETVRWALENPEEMAIMATNAKMRAQDFSEEKMVLETLQVLQKLAKGSA